VPKVQLLAFFYYISFLYLSLARKRINISTTSRGVNASLMTLDHQLPPNCSPSLLAHNSLLGHFLTLFLIFYLFFQKFFFSYFSSEKRKSNSLSFFIPQLSLVSLSIFGLPFPTFNLLFA